MRLISYQHALEQLLSVQRKQMTGTKLSLGFEQMILKNSSDRRTLRRRYSITPLEEAWVLAGLSSGTEAFPRLEKRRIKMAQSARHAS
jgi:hypothetical protein